MSKPSKDLPGVRLPFTVPYGGALVAADACARMTESWLDTIWALWRPWFDLQAQWARQAAEASGWPLPPALWLRGGEELA
jgi:hypothetical protein